jgi:hypothetical protein
MAKHSAKLACQVFLSYPHSERLCAENLARRMRRAGFELWIDDDAIEPGTPDWEANIRVALTNSFALVVLSSPATVESQYVQAEIKLAQKLGRPVIPLWVRGDDWLDCIPLGLVNCQYIDCRRDQFEQGAERLEAQLRKIVARYFPQLFIAASLKECPPGFGRIIMAKRDGEKLDIHFAAHVAECPFGQTFPDNLQVIAFNPDSYSSLEKLLDDLHLQYLRMRYTPYTYGRDWVLARPSSYVSLLALPWQWLLHKRQRLLIDVVEGYTERSTPLSECGADQGIWAIVDSGFDAGYGLWTSNERAISCVFNDHPKELYFKLRRCQRVTSSSRSEGVPTGCYRLDQLDPVAYKHKVVIVADCFGQPSDCNVLMIDEIPRE